MKDEKNNMDKTMGSISQVAGHEPLKDLKEKYPDKFDDSILKRFSGAEPYGKKKNEQGWSTQERFEMVTVCFLAACSGRAHRPGAGHGGPDRGSWSIY